MYENDFATLDAIRRGLKGAIGDCVFSSQEFREHIYPMLKEIKALKIEVQELAKEVENKLIEVQTSIGGIEDYIVEKQKALANDKVRTLWS